MLSASEIQNLEKKVSQYRFKRTMTFVGILSLIFTSIIGASILVYLNPSFLSKEKIVASDTAGKNDANHSLTPIATADIKSEKNVTMADNNKTLTLSTPKVIIDKNLKSDTPKREIRTDNFYVKNPTEQKEEPFYRSVEDKIDTSVLKPPGMTASSQNTVTTSGGTTATAKPKGAIKIETQDTASIPQLKERFEKTQNPTFAVMLAEEFYNAKNYKESIKWSLMANQLEPENDKSWVLFAKSKVKMGEKEDAITALKAYLVHNKSNSAQALLSQITLGDFHE